MKKRFLKLEIPQGQSLFLWGARKTGKTTFLKNSYPNSFFVDLLNNELYFRYLKEPYLLRQEILAIKDEISGQLVIIDEIQRVPELLNEVHWLIENTKLGFILCSSSARKLKSKGVNLLGGRAWKYHFFPFVYPEIQDEFDLLKVINNGCIPGHYNSEYAKKHLRAYVQEYLTQEIIYEGLVRKVPEFVRFIDIAAFSNTQMLNFVNIARECGIDTNTVKEYFKILEDTLVGYFVHPFTKKIKRELIFSVPKFYFFDVGVVSSIHQRNYSTLSGADAGAALENYILSEIKAYIELNEYYYDIKYWKTRKGQEVDFVVTGSNNTIQAVIEVKISKKLHNNDLKNLKLFSKDYGIETSYVVCNETAQRLEKSDSGNILILPVEEFLKKLWNNQIIKD